MAEKLKAIFDSKMTWASIGAVAGTVFGDQAAAVVSAVGALVMTVL